MSDTNSKLNPWEVKTPQKSSIPWPTFPSGSKPVAPAQPPLETTEQMVKNFSIGARWTLRATIDKVNGEQLEGSINAPRALPKLNRREVYEFPLHCLGEPLQAAVEAIAAKSQCHADIAAQVVMGYVSLAQQGHVDVKLPWNGTISPSSLFLATVAESGDRKSSADKEVAPTVQRWENELARLYKKQMSFYAIQMEDWTKKRDKIMKEESLTPEQKFDEIGPAPDKPTPPVLTGDNPTVEGLRDLFDDGAKVLGLFSDDGGTFLGGHGMSQDQALKTIATLSQMWEAKPLNKIRAKGPNGARGYGRLNKYRLAVHLMIQPEVADEFFGNKLYAGQGLLSRFLTAWPDNEELDGQRFSQDRNPEHDHTIRQFTDHLYSMLSTTLPGDPLSSEWTPVVLEFTPEADKLRREWNDSNQRHLVPGGKYAAVKGLVNKGLENAARIAANLERVYNLNATHISAHWFKNSLEIIDYYISQQLATSATKNNPAFVKAHKLYDWLNEHCELEYVGTAYLLNRSPFRTKPELEAVIKTLEEFGLLQDAGPGRDVEGHRVKKSWKVNRDLYE
jgi:hypothetical protein